ncbi:putative poly [Apostichopus japonicus]|uniref:Putative poly n=1 Tax=Stichopus japonicus TaxID=307972 RepID=A0A2G8KN61_STIJA|nr:putative poly [Apostichopus japonicus]
MNSSPKNNHTSCHDDKRHSPHSLGNEDNTSSSYKPKCETGGYTMPSSPEYIDDAVSNADYASSVFSNIEDYDHESDGINAATLKSLSSVAGAKTENDSCDFVRCLPKCVNFSFPREEWHRLKETQNGRCFGRGEWQKSVLEIIKKSNPFCSFKFSSHRVSMATFRKRRQPAFSTTATCQFDDCNCALKFVVFKGLDGKLTYSGKVQHAKDDIKARFIRRAERKDLYHKFSMGSLKPMKMQISKLSSLQGAIYESGNRDGIGETHHVLQKISSESRSHDRMDSEELKSLLGLMKKQKEEINKDTSIRGYYSTYLSRHCISFALLRVD